MGNFYSVFGSVNPTSDNVVDFAMLQDPATGSGCDKTNSFVIGYRAGDYALRSIGFNVVVGDMAINEGTTLDFSSLESKAKASS